MTGAGDCRLGVPKEVITSPTTIFGSFLYNYTPPYRITSVLQGSSRSNIVNLPQRPPRWRPLKGVQRPKPLPFESSSECLGCGRSSVHREYDIRHVLELHDTERIRAFTNST
jgi:hypothetical protein